MKQVKEIIKEEYHFDHEIKCPLCGGSGYKYLYEKRYYYKCLTCGNSQNLKLLNAKI